ncbi:MAG: Rho GTPase [Alectoria sarmentosa]|nr:MAG: Rho GTPase [Alectoria sarmentosa]CAD6571413.1 MAG: Rho GTPase [Alectoria sarmentosa]
MAEQTYENYDFLRRGSRRSGVVSSQSGSISPHRKPVRQQSTRNSNGTTSAASSSDRISAGTNITQPPAYSKKFVVVGDGGCGKTCLLISYSQGYFPEKYVPTVFENYLSHTEHKPSGKTVELALWDTAGQEEYDRLRPLSYPETDLLFVCFAIDCPNSLENIMDKWYPEVLHFCPTTPLMLVGLKSDLRTKRACIDLLKTQGLTPVTQEQGQNVARQMGATYVECSSKEMLGVHEIFDLAVDTAVGREIQMKERKQTQQSFGGNGAAVGAGREKKSKKRECRIL